MLVCRSSQVSSATVLGSRLRSILVDLHPGEEFQYFWGALLLPAPYLSSSFWVRHVKFDGYLRMRSEWLWRELLQIKQGPIVKSGTTGNGVKYVNTMFRENRNRIH
jgi:hypothetical protein